MAHLFISYPREDGKQFSDRLQADLRPHEAWLDRAEIVGGEEWAREIEKGIDGSHAFLAVLTRAYRASRVAGMELQRAFRKNKVLIPLRVHADAEPPLLLETTQYIDFSDPAERETSLRTLLDRIRTLPANGAADITAAPAATWDAIVARAAKHTQRFVHEFFGADLYVRRETAEQELARFLAEAAPALILIGDSGTGKTQLLCRWALDLLEQGHAVLAYDCGALAGADIEHEVERDLGALEHLEAETARAGRKLVLLFDSIGDYHGGEQNGVQVLLRRINAVAGRVGEHVRIVMSCNAATWTRMGRLASLRLERESYFRSSAGEPFLRLAPFTPAELDDAYRLYRAAFDLFSPLEELPPEVRERLRDPVLLRMIAEGCRGVETPLRSVDSTFGIYRRFFDERVVLASEKALIDRLAEQMIARQSSALAIADLARDPQLGPEILREDTASTYSRLLDRGVLQESHGDARAGTVVRFAYGGVAAYALASQLRRSPNLVETVRGLVAQDAQFPLAWDVAKTLLLITKEKAAFIALAESRDLEERELAAEGLVELHAEEGETTRELLQALLEHKSEEARRTALKAAYNIGPATRDFLLGAATADDLTIRESVKNTLYLIWRNESPVGRRSVTDTLYLIWRHSPGFTHEFLNSLIEELTLTKIRKFRTITEFVLDLTITIYINHCNDEEVIQKTAALLHDLAVNRLHLNLFSTGILGTGFEKIVVLAVSRVFSEQILSWMLFADASPTQTFFELPKQQRASLARIADVFDPASKLAAARADLLTMLASGTPIFAGSAVAAIAVHASHDFAATEPLIEDLWNSTGNTGRLWLLMGFSVLLEDTPAEWVGLLEKLTGRYVEEHRDTFLSPASKLAGDLDLVLLPLGLAYGKRGASMPFFEKLLQDALAKDDAPLAARTLGALGAVGFYYPHRMFDVIRPAMQHLENTDIKNTLVSTLATIRTLHFDAVDQFLKQTDAPEALRHRIDAAADVTLIDRYIHVLGYYNNAVHFTLRYPRMRKPLSAGALRLLAEAKDDKEFIRGYTAAALRMLRESRYQVLEWTLPE
jgi:hypothetical protein